MLYLKLIWVFFQIGLLSFGGGYAVLPMIDRLIVQELGWMTPQQFIDVLTISEMTPGPIAINAATFVGNQLLGVPGGIVATLGIVLPSMIIVILLAYFFFKFQEVNLVQDVVASMSPAVVALIASAGLTIILTAFFGTTSFPVVLADFNVISFIIFVISLGLLRKYEINPIRIIIGSGIAGFIIFSFVV